MIRHFDAIIVVLLLPTFASPMAHIQSMSDAYCDANASADPGPGVEHHGNSTETCKSLPLTPPLQQVNKTDGASLAPGLIFLTVGDITRLAPVTKQPAPYIFTDKGVLAWAGPTVNSTNVKWQELHDNSVLTYWSGLTTSAANVGHGYRDITILESSYNSTVICPNYGLNTGLMGTYSVRRTYMSHI